MDTYNKFNKEREELKQKFIKDLGLSQELLPNDVSISTMTIEARLDTNFKTNNILKYIRKSEDGIKGVKIPRHRESKAQGERAVFAYGRKRKKAEKDQKQVNPDEDVIFLNQVTVEINVPSKKDKPVSVKIFDNGSLHFTGCTNLDHLFDAVDVICKQCKQVCGIFENGKMKDIVFATNYDKLYSHYLYDIKIDMINCYFSVPFKIDRRVLRNKLSDDGYKIEYDSNKHAAVNIKYVTTDKKITIFIFESGSVIIILGNQGFDSVKETYTFVYKYLLNHYDKISKNEDLVFYQMQKYINESPNNVSVKSKKKKQIQNTYDDPIYKCYEQVQNSQNNSQNNS